MSYTNYYKKLNGQKEICRLIPRSKTSWVGKKYEDAYLLGFGRGASVVLLTKIKGKKRSKSRSTWTVSFWKVPSLTPHTKE